MSDPTPSIPERLIRLEGKLDAYAAGQSARLDGIDKRLDTHQTAIDDLRAADTRTAENLRTAVETLRAGTRTPMAGWQVAAVIVAALVGVGSLLGVGISLVQAITGAG